MDLTFPLCESSEGLSPLGILQEQYTHLQAKVPALPLPSHSRPPYAVLNLCLAYFWFVALILLLLFFRSQKNKNRDDLVVMRDLKIKITAQGWR